MAALVDLIKQALHPSSLMTVLMLFTIGAALLYVRDGRWGRRWITTVAIGYWIIAMPAGAACLEWPLTRRLTPIDRIEQAAGARVIVVLSGGSLTFKNGALSVSTAGKDTAYRIIEAVRLYRLLDRPTIIASGGKPMPIQTRSEAQVVAEALRELGVAGEDILLEQESMNTYDEAVVIRRMLAARHIDRFVLVTSAVHMPRSMAVFEAQGLHPVAGAAFEPPDHQWWGDVVMQFVPSRLGLLKSDSALYEYAGLLYYRSQGRLTQSLQVTSSS